ncbi:MAG: RNA polymerase sigma factor [Proteobacteria bacterium]|nr:MAG: RNA polymerase sigma factor [Pseudomonadota bacterium]
MSAIDGARATRLDEHLSDEAVVARVRDGAIHLFELVMRRNNRRIYRAARAILRDDAEAEDVLQQTYVQAFARLDQWKARGGFGAWLTGIAVHEALARLRRRNREAPSDLASDGAPSRERLGADPEREAARGELQRVLEDAIDALPEPLRVVVVLRDVEGLSTAEAAASLSVSEEAVRTRLHRARAALRCVLRGRIGEWDAAFPFFAPRCDRVVAAVLLRIGQTAAP